MTPNQKGKILEQAVEAIEGAIAKSFPGIADKTCHIESRKIAVVDGVTHEIDLWVEVDLGRGYKSLFIFECKNWAAPVDKNEVIVLSEKVKSVGAQRGFLVARELTADALAQMQKDKRIEFVKASDLPTDDLTEAMSAFRSVGIERHSMALEFLTREESGDRVELQQAAITATLGGQSLDLNDFVSRWTLEETRTLLVNDLGIHRHELVATREYAQGELLLDRCDIAKLELRASVSLHVTSLKILSAFDIESRGRAIVLEPISVPGGGALEIAFADVHSR